MTQTENINYQTDEDLAIKSQMERMVNTYDSYMKWITLGRENTLREITVDLALPPGGFSRSVMKILLGFMLKHDLKELFPIMESSGFSEVRLSKVPFRIMGLTLLSFVSVGK